MMYGVSQTAERSSSGEEQTPLEDEVSDPEIKVITPRRSARLKTTASLGSSSLTSISSLSSSSHTPSTSSISTNITTPPLSPKPALPVRTPLRKVRIPALKGKAAARRVLVHGGESNKAAGLGIPVEATPIHNSSILASPMSTALHPASDQSPAKPKLESESKHNIPSIHTPSPSKQFLSFPPRHKLQPSSTASPQTDVTRGRAEIKEDEFLAELAAPFIRRPITSGIWRILPEDIPVHCRRQHPDSMKNRIIWSNQQQRRLIAMGFEADLEIESAVFMRDGCMISWKTKIPVYPDTLKIHNESSESHTQTNSASGSSSSPEGFRRSSRTRRKSWKRMAETSPNLTRSRSSKSQTSGSADILPTPPTKQKEKYKTSSSDLMRQSNNDDAHFDNNIMNRVRHGPTAERSVSPPSTQIEPSRVISPIYPRSPSANSADREDAAMVEQLLNHTSRSSSPMEDVHNLNSHHNDPHISSDDDMYMSWSDYEKAKIVPAEPPKSESTTNEVLPRPERRLMGVPVPTFSFENRVARVLPRQQDLEEKTILVKSVDSLHDVGMDTSW